MEEHPVRSVNIQGVPAVAWARAPHGEIMTVGDAVAADKALGDADNLNICPLCHEGFGPRAFKAHAQACINARVPAWERMRARMPRYFNQKRFSSRLFRGGL